MACPVAPNSFSTSTLISAAAGRGNSKTVITSLRSSGIEIRGDTMTIFLGTDLRSLAKFQSLQRVALAKTGIVGIALVAINKIPDVDGARTLFFGTLGDRRFYALFLPCGNV